MRRFHATLLIGLICFPLTACGGAAGAGLSSTASVGKPTTCDLATRRELEAIVGVPLDEGTADGYVCRYTFTNLPFRLPMKITAHREGGKSEVIAARGAERFMSGQIQKDTGMKGLISGGPVDGVGDEAFYTLAAIMPMLTARIGDTGISIEGAERDQMAAIARLLLPRIAATTKPGR